MATKIKRHKSDAPEHQSRNESRSKGNGFPLDARQIGVAVAGVLVSEIANIAVQKLSEKAFKKDDQNDFDDDNLHDNENGDSVNPLYAVAAKAGDKVGQVESSAGDVADAVRSSIGNLKISLSDVIDVFRDAGQQLKTQSASAFNTSSEVVSENVANTTTAVRDRIIPQAKSEFKEARKTKKNKKKNKNKKK
jgi:hypothetical protein